MTKTLWECCSCILAHMNLLCVLKEDLWDGGNCLQQVLTY